VELELPQIQFLEGYGTTPIAGGPDPVEDWPSDEEDDLEADDRVDAARAVLAASAADRRERFEVTATGTEVILQENEEEFPYDEISANLNTDNGDSVVGSDSSDSQSVPPPPPPLPAADEEGPGFLTRLGTSVRSGVEWFAKNWETRTVLIYYDSRFAVYVNDDLLPENADQPFRTGWNRGRDWIPDYRTHTSAGVRVAEYELVWKDRETEGGWQTGIPRFDFVTGGVTVEHWWVSEQGRAYLEEKAKTDDNINIQN